MIGHEEAVIQIAELAEGRLPREREEALEEHLRVCEDCRSLRETFQMLSTALRDEAEQSPADHPSSAEVVEYALRPDKLGEEDRDRLTSHLDRCHACSEEVAATRQAVAEARSFAGVPFTGSGSWSRLSGGWAALAAGILLLLLVYPAYLGVVRLPEVSREASELRAAKEAAEKQAADGKTSRDSHPSWSGGAAESVYLEAIRGGEGRGEIPVVRPREDSRMVAILLEPLLPEGLSDADPCRFEILDAAGGVLWSVGLTAGEIRQDLESTSHTVTLLVPTPYLATGRLELRLVEPRSPSPRTLLRLPFEVVR